MPDPLQNAVGSYNAQAYGEGASATVTVGFTPEQIAPLLQAAGAAAQARITELAAQLTTSHEVTQGFLRILREDDVPTEQLSTKLNEIANRYLGMMQRLEALDPEDATARSYIERAQQVLSKASSAHDYDRADDLLCRAEEAQGDSIDRVEALEREAHDAARRLRRGKAATRAERAQLSFTRLDYLQAAEHYRVAAGLLASEDAALRRGYLVSSASALDDYSDEKGDNYVLLQAIERYRELLRETPRASLSLDWAAVENDMGVSLWKLGERESGTARLEEAVAAYRSALEERTHERVPLYWAATQSNLGNALWTLGERESGTARLEEAVAAHRSALQEHTRERVPLAWAATQNNLGNALCKLGQRESGTTRLEEAVAVYQMVLEERTRECVPLDWAMTQNNLGNALWTLGERESGTARLTEAVKAFRLALEEYTRERVPLYRAMTQNNLGTALQMLGERESGTVRLEEARVAIARAWEVCSSAGMTQYDRGFEDRLAAIDALIKSRIPQKPWWQRG